ncbi:1-acyl-sn-glycerol-3-phosphate acyltransferase [Pusillimonas sp. ANT_WB101]|uniref:lysophospholipid acyltransferase family protein n=1 Tax=Pusillimonas sp. ANT_WB101 TaxID=2597356 RepID=UPI0011ED7089|nr:1-acyl-sn-glycerol-3-phosphate acyltransferase [Pusillimonas sp. ANT_WB101]KAA0889232.1 1-acyl-sn-glycerol-3-phosphate acyltransferase [Pusillimonas sp. ANT_WB101]
MSLLRFVPRLVLLILWIVTALLWVLAVFPLVSQRLRASVTQGWSRALMRFCGIRVVVKGDPCTSQPFMLVANHVSWVDIFVVNSVCPTSFVAKSEIRRWPLLGWLAAGTGTVFIQRGMRSALSKASNQIKERLERGHVVGLFPEGTTSPGFDVGPFHSSLFQVAIEAGIDIQPVALRFLHGGERSDYVSFVGEQSLLQNIWRLLGTTGVSVEAVFLPVMPHADCFQQGRSHAAAHARQGIRKVVMVADQQTHPADGS